MLGKCIKVELLKLKRNPIWIPFVLLPMMSAFMGTVNFMMNQGILSLSWHSLWTQHSLFLCFFFLPALIGTLCSSLWRPEYMHNNMNALMSSRASRFTVYLAKLITACIVNTLAILWIYTLYIVCGKFCGIVEPFGFDSLEWIVCGIGAGIVICSIQMFLSLIIRKFAIPIGIAIAGGFCGLGAIVKGVAVYFPYSLLPYGMRANNPDMVISIPAFIISCIVFTTLFCILAFIWLRKKDVKA